MAQIYKITNIKNGIIYIGSTTNDIKERLKEHFKSAYSGCKSNLLYEDMRNQSKKDFTIEIIDECQDKHMFMIEEWYTRQAIKNGKAIYNQKYGNANDRNTKIKIQNKHLEGIENGSINYEVQKGGACCRYGKNNGMYGKSGENSINGRMIYMLDDNKQVIKIFPSTTAWLEYYHMKGHSMLNKACREGFKYKGHYWTKEWTKSRTSNDHP